MARQRTELRKIFREILGNKNTYFQPPASFRRNYPCIQYELENEDANFADNRPYKTAKRYTVTIIDSDPDSELPEKLRDTLPYCRWDRTYATEGLNHFVFTLYF